MLIHNAETAREFIRAWRGECGARYAIPRALKDLQRNAESDAVRGRIDTNLADAIAVLSAALEAK